MLAPSNEGVNIVGRVRPDAVLPGFCYDVAMSLIYVTGIASSGKSEVCDELLKLGYEAHEGDDNLSYFYNNESGQVVNRPTSASERTPEWREQHTWKMSKEKLLELKNKAKDKPIFVCGVAANENEYIDIFDKVFALMIDDRTMRHRIETRTRSDYGKNSHEMADLIEWQKSTQEHYQKIGAQVIDATKPISEVVNEIVTSI